MVLPFLVRRDACYAEPGARPPRELSVVLPDASLRRPRYVYVPEGWTLVNDDPPRWELVDSFFLQRREVTYRQLLGWLNRIEAEGLSSAARDRPELQPRWAERMEDLHVLWSEAESRWVLGPDNELDWPARGLTWTDIEQYAELLNVLEPRPRGVALRPAVAGRSGCGPPGGPTGGPSPGATSSTGRAASAIPRATSPSATTRPPRRSATPPADRSPFGLLDMAGSVSEALSEPFGPIRGEFAFAGGSYRSTDEAAMGTLSVRAVSNLQPHRRHRLPPGGAQGCPPG